MMLAGISDEISQDLDEAIAVAQSVGLNGLEIRSFAGTDPARAEAADMRLASAALSRAGLAVAGYCPPLFKTPLPRDRRAVAEQRARFSRHLDLASVLGAPHVRVFSWVREADTTLEQAAEAFAAVTEGVAGAAPCLLETGTITHTPTAPSAVRFADLLPTPIQLLWDPGNSVFGGASPAETADLPDDVLRRVGHVHVKDPRGRHGYVRLGDGDLDWLAIIRRLDLVGYDRWLSLETHWRVGGALTRQLRDAPWGRQFSAGGLGATVECAQRLRRMHALAVAS